MIKRTSAIILMAVFLSTGCSSVMDMVFPQVYGENDSLDEVVEAGKYQEIIIKSHDEEELKRINTKKEIVEFVENEQLENQTYFAGPLPTDAEKLLIFEYWQEPTKTVFGGNNKKLELVATRALYISDGVYYWVLEIPRYFTNTNIMPEDAAHYFIDLVQ